MAYHNSNYIEQDDIWSPQIVCGEDFSTAFYGSGLLAQSHAFNNEAQLACHYTEAPGLTITSNGFVADPYHSPNQDFLPPYYSSPSTRSSANSDRRSQSQDPSPTPSLLLTPNQYHPNLAVAGLSLCEQEIDANEAYESCVAMQHVQRYADTPFDDTGFDDYGQPQEVVPLRADEHDYTSPSIEHHMPVAQTSVHSQPQQAPAPAIGRQRSARQRRPKAKSGNRVSKRTSTRRTRIPTPESPTSSEGEPTRAFPCPLAPYGCTAAFGAKNEWKRHASTQHFRLGFWRCDQCTQIPDRPNDFNRKDLFIQHVRRMHSSPAPSTSTKKKRSHGNKVAIVEATLNKIAERCYRNERAAPESCCCVFCDTSFPGKGCLESRMEHVGKHMERRKKEGLEPLAVGTWRSDGELEQWMVQHKLLVKTKGPLRLA